MEANDLATEVMSTLLYKKIDYSEDSREYYILRELEEELAELFEEYGLDY